MVAFSTKKSSKGKAPGKAGTRFWKNVGLGFKTPREAIEGEVRASGSIISVVGYI
jgi:small subunit ribosomal protein S11e